jgi:predicted acylesterase/phospholipase RssA
VYFILGRCFSILWHRGSDGRRVNLPEDPVLNHLSVGLARRSLSEFGQIVLVLQSGGALGAYQAGVYQALHEVGVEPDWVIGTSIGAINASLIAGTEPEHRLAKLEEFWNRVGNNSALETAASVPGIGLELDDSDDGDTRFLQTNPVGVSRTSHSVAG